MSQEDFLRAVRDGKISTTVLSHDELYSKYKAVLSASASMRDAIVKVSVQEGVSESTVYRAIMEFQGL